MGFIKRYAEQQHGFGGFWKKLFCLHLTWSKLPIEDWRTDEYYWQCNNCGKIKNFPFGFMPVNYEE